MELFAGSRLWTFDVAQALDRFVAFCQDGSSMTTSQKLHRQKHLQKQQKPSMVAKTKHAGRPSTASLPPPIPQALLDIIVRCLVPDREQRFQDLAFVLTLLRRLFFMSTSIVYPRLLSLSPEHCAAANSSNNLILMAAARSPPMSILPFIRSMLQSQSHDCVVLYNICTLLLHSGLLDPPITLLVMHECCMRESAVSETEQHEVSGGMRVAAFLLAAKTALSCCRTVAAAQYLVEELGYKQEQCS